jgi:hypothetical protein
MNWQPHFCYESKTTHRNGTETRYVRHWIFGVLVRDTFPKVKTVIADDVPAYSDMIWTELKKGPPVLLRGGITKP